MVSLGLKRPMEQSALPVEGKCFARVQYFYSGHVGVFLTFLLAELIRWERDLQLSIHDVQNFFSLAQVALGSE